MIKNPLALDHYAYVNQLLGLKDEKSIAPKKELADKQKIIEKLMVQQKAFEAIKDAKLAAEAQENALKIQRVLEVLNDAEKKKKYDDGLTGAASMELKHPLKEKGTPLVPLVPIEDIINEFNDFKKEMLELKDAQGKPLFNEDDFKYEKIDGPPTVHVFSFRDEATANKFLDRLFSKNMAMHPNGSQSTKATNPAQSYSDALTAIRSVKEEPAPVSSPTPFNTTPGLN